MAAATAPGTGAWSDQGSETEARPTRTRTGTLRERRATRKGTEPAVDVAEPDAAAAATAPPPRPPRPSDDAVQRTRFGLLLTAGAAVALRVALGCLAVFFLLASTLPTFDYVLLAVPAALIVPLGLVIAVALFAGVLLWENKWLFLYSSTLGCVSLDSGLCLLGAVLAGVYLAYGVAVTTGGVPLQQVLEEAGVETAGTLTASAMAFQFAAFALLMGGVLGALVDFAAAYFAASAQYLVEYEVADAPAAPAPPPPPPPQEQKRA
jgi:hypothetical protein